MERSAPFLGGQSSARFLGLIHLVETCRYHLFQFEMLTAGQGDAPPGFEPGIKISPHEVDHLYRFMVSWFEMEAFFMAGKRFLDTCWCFLAEQYGNGADKIKTLGSALDKAKLSTHVKSEILNQISNDTYYCELHRIWNVWGRELANLRNYMEHEIPFGGMTFNEFKIWQQDGRQCFDTFLPDQIRRGKSYIPKHRFTFQHTRSLREYMRERMMDIDTLVETLFPILDGHPMVE
jgi:hypothetical protein